MPTTSGGQGPLVLRAWPCHREAAVTTTTIPAPPIPILLNITTRAGFGVEWTTPDDDCTMQLTNPCGTHYLLLSLRPHPSAEWLTMGVASPKRFGLHTPAVTFGEFLPVAQAFVAAVEQATGPSPAGRPRMPTPQHPDRRPRRPHRQRNPSRAPPLPQRGCHATKVLTVPRCRPIAASHLSATWQSTID
jgi:hypothetical protein